MGPPSNRHPHSMRPVPKVALGRWVEWQGDRPVLYELSHIAHSVTE